MIEISIIILLCLAAAALLTPYLYKVSEGRPGKLDFIFDKADNFIYKTCAIDRKEMLWKRYLANLLIVNIAAAVFGFIILKLQSLLFLNPNAAANMPSGTTLNTVISFITNTNLQHYAGETDLSYLSQIAVITFMMFVSAATGYSACVAFLRGLIGSKKTIGNYYVDMTRFITRVLIPLSFIIGLFLISQGTPQNFSKTIKVQTIENSYQDIVTGPVASLVSIKHLGTNGGGFLSANSSSPQENPTVLTNIVEMVSMTLIPLSLIGVFAMMLTKRRRETNSKNFSPRHAFAIFASIGIIFIILLSVSFHYEQLPNPNIAKTGIQNISGNMEGKEYRFAVAQSSLFTTITTAFSTGSINNSHDSLSPLGAMSAMLAMMLNVVFGGSGAGLMNILIYVMLTVFLSSLMIGRSPEYLSKKIEVKEMKLIAICIIIHPLLILSFSALAVISKAGAEAVTNPSFHGFGQILYQFASAAANNGSEFSGLKSSTAFFNNTTAIVMLLGRYVPIILQFAIIGSLLNKENSQSALTLKTDTITFALMLTVVIIIFAALTFLPALALSSIAEHLTLWK